MRLFSIGLPALSPPLKLLLLVAASFLAQPAAAADDARLRLVDVFRVENPRAVVVGLLNYDPVESPELVLLLDEVPFPELEQLDYKPTGERAEEAAAKGIIYRRFLVQRKVISHDSWRRLYERNDRRVFTRVEVDVGLALKEGAQVVSDMNSSAVRVWLISPFYSVLGAALILVMLVSFALLLARSRIVRAVGPDTPADQLAAEIPYSLGRTQMAFWFFLVASSYLFIWAVTGQYEGVLSASELVLLGISASTALGAVMIDGAENAERELDKADEIDQLKSDLVVVESALEEKQAQLSKAGAQQRSAVAREVRELQRRKIQVEKALGFLEGKTRGFHIDLISDEHGVTIHRFQILGWTLVLGMIFAATVISTLQLPKFDAITLSLMGISSGAYLGFKFPGAGS